MKKTILFTVIIFAAAMSFGQGFIYYGDKKYESTPAWKFYIKNYYWPIMELEINVAKNDKGDAFLMMVAGIKNQKDSIHDTLTLVLADSSKIVSVKGQNYYGNGNSNAFYDLSPSDIGKLKASNIERVMFTLNNGENDVRYSAVNNSEKAYLRGFKMISVTAKYVAELFGK